MTGVIHKTLLYKKGHLSKWSHTYRGQCTNAPASMVAKLGNTISERDYFVVLVVMFYLINTRCSISVTKTSRNPPKLARHYCVLFDVWHLDEYVAPAEFLSLLLFSRAI